MNEPHMAPWWFPANDHPTTRPGIDVHITVPRGRGWCPTGCPAGSRAHGDLVTWHWRAADPMVALPGVLRRRRLRGRARPPRRAALAGRRLAAAWPATASGSRPGWLRRTPRITAWLESELGDYPFESTGGLVTSLSPGFALENQTRPTYPFVGGSSTWLLVHELAHQWFGDSVSVQAWRDVWLNEGFATYMEARYAEAHGGPGTAAWLRRAYGEYGAGESFWRAAGLRPGTRPDLRRCGLRPRRDDARGAPGGRGRRRPSPRCCAPGWSAGGTATAAPRTSSALAEELSGRDLDAFFDAWLVAPVKPADTAANGLG